VGRATGAEEDGVGVAPCFERLEFFSRWQSEILSEFSLRGLVLHLRVDHLVKTLGRDGSGVENASELRA